MTPLVALYLRRKDSPPEAEAELVAYGKTLEEIKGWYKHNQAVVGGPLEAYEDLETTFMNLRHNGGVLGFFELVPLELIMEDAEKEVQHVNQMIQSRIDSYRTHIEPKAISFDTSPEAALRRSN